MMIAQTEFDSLLEFYKSFVEKAEFDLQSILLYLLLSSVALLVLFFRFYIENSKRKKEIELLKIKATEELRISNDEIKTELQKRFQEMLIEDSLQYREFITKELDDNKKVNQLLLKEKEELKRRIDLLEIELRHANLKIVENEKVKESNLKLKYELDKLTIESDNMRGQIAALETENVSLKKEIEHIQNEYEKRDNYIKELEVRIEILSKQTGELKNGRNNSSTD